MFSMYNKSMCLYRYLSLTPGSASTMKRSLLLLFFFVFNRLHDNVQNSNGFLSAELAHISVVEERSILHRRPLTPLSAAPTKEVSRECEIQATKTISAALNSRGKYGPSRARRLFEHSLASCPDNPKILNAFGEFLEPTDLLEADRFYSRSIACSLWLHGFIIERSRAPENWMRIADLVKDVDEQILQQIDDKKKIALLRREATWYLNTTLAQAAKDEALGAALKDINPFLAAKVGNITFEDVLKIHEGVMRPVNAFQAGKIRRTQVWVGHYTPPPHHLVNVLMERFLEWLNSFENKLAMHPVCFAALAHYKLVYIHPFQDGNGRTARVLMNLILVQAGLPPVTIGDQTLREHYIQELVAADLGDLRPFVRFVAGCIERSLNAYLEN